MWLPIRPNSNTRIEVLPLENQAFSIISKTLDDSCDEIKQIQDEVEQEIKQGA